MKLRLTRPQIAGEAIGIILMIGMFVFIAVQWNQLPDQVPGHFNAEGEVDRWGSKNEILASPIVTAVMYVFLTVVSYLPPILNVPTKGKQKNWDRMYHDLRNLMILIKVEISASFFFVTYHVATSQPLPIWYLPVFLVAVLGTTFFYVSRLVRSSLESESGAY